MTSAKLATIASELNTLHGALAERASDFGDVIDSTCAALDLLGQTWRGPVRDDMQGQVSSYVDSVASVVAATDSAAATVEGWATAATDASDRLAGLEQAQSTAEAMIAASTEDDGADRRRSSLTRINGSIADEVTAWATTCVAKGAELASAIATVQQASLVEMGTADQRSALRRQPLTRPRRVGGAARHGPVDPRPDRWTGSSGERAAGRLRRQRVRGADVRRHRDDEPGRHLEDGWPVVPRRLAVLGRPDIVRFRLEIAARLAGIELSEDQLDELTGQIINAAVFGAATDDDGRGAIDDQFDEHTGIEAALDDDQPSERDFEFPENATAADEYVQTWLEAQWEGDKGLLDYAKMLVIPDFAVMNPWSDEFHPGWAIVEVLGIIPWTKVTKLATLAKLGRHGDEMADAVRLFDEGADILGDAGRISDDVAGASDDLLRASDELAQSGDEIAAAAGDDLSHLAKADPRVVAQLDDVRTPVMDELQTQVDRIWAETQAALPDASPQQLGTRAHRELDVWIQAHADELVPPESGYRIQSEVSFVDGGELATRGTAARSARM